MTENIAQQNFLEEATITQGRLAFSSKESFAKVYGELADASDEKLSSYFNPLYEKGFYSLRPIVTSKNEEFIYNHYAKRTNQIARRESIPRAIDEPLAQEDDRFDYLDDLEDIVGDDAFAAFLNSEAEILIGSDVYKYTDVGLFITPANKYAVLEDYLDSHNISQEMTIPTTESVKADFYNANRCAPDLLRLTEDIAYFSEATSRCSGGGGGNGGGGNGGGSSGTYTPTPGSVTSTDPSYNAFVGSLTECNPSSGTFGNFFFNVFGDNNVCIDHYENRRRVKTKAFNYNYFLVYHLGVKCVHQFRGWTRLWRVEANDEIRLVVEAAQFEYDLDKLLGNTAVNNLTQERVYFMNNQKIFYQANSITLPNWGAPSISYTNMNSLPGIFKDNLSFEFFGTGYGWLDTQIQNGIDNNLNASKLNEYFYNGLYKIATSQLQNALGSSTNTPATRTFVAKFPENGKLIFQKSVLDQGFRIGEAQKTFDWGVALKLKRGGGGWKMSGGVGDVLARPKNFRVKIIGAVRGGSRWHGSKFTVGI